MRQSRPAMARGTFTKSAPGEVLYFVHSPGLAWLGGEGVVKSEPPYNCHVMFISLKVNWVTGSGKCLGRSSWSARPSYRRGGWGKGNERLRRLILVDFETLQNSNLSTSLESPSQELLDETEQYTLTQQLTGNEKWFSTSSTLSPPSNRHLTCGRLPGPCGALIRIHPQC